MVLYKKLDILELFFYEEKQILSKNLLSNIIAKMGGYGHSTIKKIINNPTQTIKKLEDSIKFQNVLKEFKIKKYSSIDDMFLQMLKKINPDVEKNIHLIENITNKLNHNQKLSKQEIDFLLDTGIITSFEMKFIDKWEGLVILKLFTFLYAQFFPIQFEYIYSIILENRKNIKKYKYDFLRLFFAHRDFYIDTINQKTFKNILKRKHKAKISTFEKIIIFDANLSKEEKEEAALNAYFIYAYFDFLEYLRKELRISNYIITTFLKKTYFTKTKNR